MRSLDLKKSALQALESFGERGLTRVLKPSFYPTLEHCITLFQLLNDGNSFFSSLRKVSNASIDLTTNDYLGLRFDKKFRQLIFRGLQEMPIGSGGSRYLGGEHPIFLQAEREIAQWQGCEDALLFASGYDANTAIVKGLASLDAKLLVDRLCHASTMSALLESKKINFATIPHLKLPTIKDLASAKSSYLSEGLFSMDGDFFPKENFLSRLSDFKDTLCFIDEAHSGGICGSHGVGICGDLKLYDHNLYGLMTFGKAFGVSGAALCGPSWFLDYLRQVNKQSIYSTAISPMIVQAILLSVSYVKGLEKRRERLYELSRFFRKGLKVKGIETCGSPSSPIVPVLIGDLQKVMLHESNLAKKGFQVRGIRSPTVKKGQERLRICLHALMTKSDIQELIDVLVEEIGKT